MLAYVKTQLYMTSRSPGFGSSVTQQIPFVPCKSKADKFLWKKKKKHETSFTNHKTAILLMFIPIEKSLCWIDHNFCFYRQIQTTAIVFKYNAKNILPFIMISHSGLKTDFPETIMKFETCFGRGCFFTCFSSYCVMSLPLHTYPLPEAAFMILFFIERV